ncbi:hypothetical protein V6N12_052896 [Hibiscus sabdariffa]|uniref:Uncharacterized protein n=1 Tax=Hibiscus sabdariffa TaxID=183260 RepID=A0ABR2C301_9ROSI
MLSILDKFHLVYLPTNWKKFCLEVVLKICSLVYCSSCSNTWDAFQLAHASFRLYCLWNNKITSSDSQKQSVKPGPCLLGDPPKIDVSRPEVDMQEEDGSLENIPAIKIYDEHVNMRFLVCGSPCLLDASLLGPLEDGLDAPLSIEVSSAPPPPLQAGTFSRGAMIMRCDFSTCSSAHMSLLVSGSAQTCFNDQAGNSDQVNW